MHPQHEGSLRGLDLVDKAMNGNLEEEEGVGDGSRSLALENDGVDGEEGEEEELDEEPLSD